jgi:hypothetical protein
VHLPRQGSGSEVADAALFLISNESSYVNAHTLFLDAIMWPESCAASLRYPNSSRHCRDDKKYPPAPHQQFFRNPMK